MTTLRCPSCSTPLALVLPSALPEEARPEPPLDLVELLARTRVQTVHSAAQVVFDTERPTQAQKQRARRALDRLVREGQATVRTSVDGTHQYSPRVDLLELLRRTRVQTAASAARVLSDTERPTEVEQQRARRKLEQLVAGGKAERRERNDEIQYVPAEPMDDLDAVL